MMSVGVRRLRPRRGLWLLGATLIAAAAMVPGGAVAQPAPQNSISISGQADWINNNQITVYVTVQGSGGFFGNIGVNVSQANPFGGMNGGGGTQIFCDGHRRTYAIAVFGGGSGWQLGQALATAQVFCPNPFPPGSDSQTIRITKP